MGVNVDKSKIDHEELKPEEATEGDAEVQVTDRRRFTSEGDPIAREDDMALPEGTETTPVEVRALKEQLAEAERQIQDYADRFRKAQLQLRQETDELRARLQRNFEQKLEAARGDVVASLLDSLDNLKRAVAAAEMSKGTEADFNALLEGVRVTAEMFELRMKTLGLVVIASQGEIFNPELHEAVEIVSVEPSQDNRVTTELQTGYKFGDRLLRPARVRVGRVSD